MKKIMLIILFSIVYPTTWACELRTSWDHWPPYQYKNEEGVLTGIDIDLMKLVASTVGCTLHFERMPWKRTLAMLQANKLDLTSSASYSQDRANIYLYSQPYRNETVSLFIHKSQANSGPFNSLDSIVGKAFKLGIVRGYHYGEQYDGLIKEGEILTQLAPANSDEQNFKMLQISRIDGALADKFVGASIVKKMSLGKEIIRLDTKVHESSIHFMLSKQPNLKPITDGFNDAIQKLNSNGDIQDILDRYLH